jgi:hypothetical protein
VCGVRGIVWTVITYRQLGRNGRLGNQLWQIASTIGMALDRGDDFAFPPWEYQPYFSVPGEHFFDLEGIDSDDLGFDWLQQLQYFAGVGQYIRQIFAPSPEAWAIITGRHRPFLDLPHKTAIHVRRADYLEFLDVFVPVSDNYYEQAMGACEPPFVVFSDDISWCRLNFPSDCLFMEGNCDWEDLFLMASCDDVITCNSTFSWWGAWLSEGRRFYPRTWFTPGLAERGPHHARLDAELMFPPGAIVLG